jgi:hypothetical protein
MIILQPLTPRGSSGSGDAQLMDANPHRMREDDGGEADAPAEYLLDLLKRGAIQRVQVEADQRADEQRMEGYRVTPPPPGTPLAEMVRKVLYRMRVRELALEKFKLFELALMTGDTRQDRVVSDTVNPGAWRSGAGYR